MRVLSIGEILWDVFPERELLGGAPLNFSANTVRLGNSAWLITGVGQDQPGRLALEAMARLGVSTEFVQLIPDKRTGVAIVSTNAFGEPAFEIPRPAAFDAVTLNLNLLERATTIKPDWLYVGTLSHTEPRIQQITRKLKSSLHGVRCFYDMNLRPGSWDLALVERLCGIASILKLNESEAQVLGGLSGMGRESFSLETFCRMWASKHQLDCICVTLGPHGCLVYKEGSTLTVPGYPATVEDTVGAGDAFAAAFLHGYHRNWPVLETARFANALGSIVASRAGATPAWTLAECIRLAGLRRDSSHLL